MIFGGMARAPRCACVPWEAPKRRRFSPSRSPPLPLGGAPSLSSCEVHLDEVTKPIDVFPRGEGVGGANAGRLGGAVAEGTASGVPRETFRPWDPAVPPDISPRAPPFSLARRFQPSWNPRADLHLEGFTSKSSRSPSIVLSSRMSEMPASFFSLTSVAIFSSSPPRVGGRLG